MTGRTSWGVRAPGPHGSRSEIDREEPLGDLREPEFDQAPARSDDAPGPDGDDNAHLGRRMRSARDRVMERLEASPPDITTEELQRAVERLARRVEATSTGQAAAGGSSGRRAAAASTAGRAESRFEDRAHQRADAPPAAGHAGTDEFDDILDRDDPRRGATGDLRRQSSRDVANEPPAAVRPAAPRHTRPETRPDMRQETLSVLDRLEARLDSLSERVEQSKAARAAAGDDAALAARKDMSRQFLALEQRIDALREVTEANSVSVLREDLSRLGRQVDHLAGDRGEIGEVINTVRDQLDRLHSAFHDRGEPESAALAAIEERLAGLAAQVGQFELAPAALDAVERGYGQILERMAKIEKIAEDTVPPDDLWDRIEVIRAQIERLPSRETVTTLENRLLELAERVDAAAAAGHDDSHLARLEAQLDKIAFSLAEASSRKEAEGDDLSRRLGDVLKRLDRMDAEGKAIDFTPIEVRLSDIAARLDTRLRGPTDRAVAAIEKRLESLARAFDDQLDLAAAGLAPLERKLDSLAGLIRDVELTGRGPDMGIFEQRLDDLQARLGEIGIEIRRSGGLELQRRFDELAARLDAFQGGETHIDMQPMAERLDRLAEQIGAIQPTAAPDLNPIQTRLDELAAALLGDGADDGEDPVAAQLAEIAGLLNAERESDIDLARIAALLEKLEAAFDRGDQPDFVALAERMVRLNETLENAAELASLEDISDLRSEIATLRRELRSLSASSGEDNDITPLLQDLAERIDHLPSETPATVRDLEDQMGRIQQAIEQSAAHNTAIDQISETLTTIQATLDDTIRYGGLATEQALGDGQGANLLMQLGRALREDLGALRSQAAEAERRTQESINALGGALATVTGRMAALESGSAAAAAMPPAATPEAPSAALAIDPDPAEFAEPTMAEPAMAEPQHPAADIDQVDTPARMPGEAEIATSPMFDPPPEPAIPSGDETAAIGFDEPQVAEPIAEPIAEPAAEAQSRPPMTAPVLETDEDDTPLTSSIEQDVAEQELAAQQQQRSETASLIAAIRGIEPKRGDQADIVSPAHTMADAGPSDLPAPEAPEMSAPEMSAPEMSAPETATPETAAPETAAPETAAPETAAPEAAAPEAAASEVAAPEVASPEVAAPEAAADIAAGEAMQPVDGPDVASETLSDGDVGGPALTGTLDVVPEPSDVVAADQPQPDKTAEPPSAGHQSFLGRLTSSQLLKRATGGRSESFTPGPDDDDHPDALLEPGTDGPMKSELDGAPSSDTAVMSGERSDDAAGRSAGAATIAGAAPGTGFVLTDGADGSDKVNDFLAAARRAARAAVIEAAEAERYAEQHRPPSPLNRVMAAVNAQRKTILAGAVVLAVAFAAWQFLQGWQGPVAPQTAETSQLTPQAGAPATMPAEGQGGPSVAKPTSEVTFADPGAQPDQFRSRQDGAQLQSPALSAPPETAVVAPLPAIDLGALQAAADAGDAKAMHDLAMAYADGAAGDADPAAAATWFIASAEAGDRDGQFRAGLAYVRGLGVPRDYVEAYKWFDIAAAGGDPQAAARRDALAKVMAPADLDRGRAATAAWFIASAEAGDPDGQFQAGLAYVRGLGVPRDYVEAYKWFDIAAAAGDPQAAARRDALAKVMTPADLDRARGATSGAASPGQISAAAPPAAPAIDLSLIPAAIGSDALRAAAISGNNQAEIEVATRYAEGRGVEQDLEQAVFWYTRAAEGGLAPAQYRLASIYEKGTGVRRNPRSAQEWYRRAAQAGNAKAMHNLAVLFAEGAAGSPDLTAAATWFKKAAEYGVRDSQFNAGILYARGLGVKQDYVEAFKWFAVAAQSGDEQAKARREAVAQAMSAEQLARARAAAQAFRPTPLDPAANVVPPASKEWGDAPAAAQSGKVSFRSPDIIEQVQHQLARLGFDPGPADGKFGPQTRHAVEAFQAATGLAVTGTIDAALMEALQSRQI